MPDPVTTEEEVEVKVDEAAEAAKKKAEAEGLSEAEVTKRVEAARKEEKDKLYPQLEEMKSALKEVQEAFRLEREEKEAIKKAAEEKAEEKRLKGLSESEVMVEGLRRLEEKLEEERKERQAATAELESMRQQDTVNAYRAQVIHAAEGKIIAEIVSGSTVEEIDRTVEIAKARYEEFIQKAKDEVGKKIKGGLSTTSPDTEALEEEELENRLSTIDKDRYEKDPEYRDKVLSMVENEYKKASGRY